MSSDALRRKLFKTPSGPGRPPVPRPTAPKQELNISKFTEIDWSEYFIEKKIVQVIEDSFCVYKLSNVQNPNLESAAIVLLHGGGFSGLTWARFAALLFKEYECEIYALDLRGHGETKTQNEYDLSVDTLTRDVANLIDHLHLTNRRIVLMGHSMGGALAVHVAQHLQSTRPVSAIIVVDVVEGSAMDSLNTMPSFLRNRPNGFDSLESAIQWSVKTGHIKELESARVSMPGQLHCSITGQPATASVGEKIKVAPLEMPNIMTPSSILEEEEWEVNEITDLTVGPNAEASTDPTCQPAKESRNPGANSASSSVEAICGLPTSQDFCLPHNACKYPYTWRIDLMKTEQHWRGWFEGLSKKFLSVSSPKLLLLAGTDRMDKELMVGHMQGKFEVQFMSNVGHAIHEDSPDGAVTHVSKFLTRHKLITAK